MKTIFRSFFIIAAVAAIAGAGTWAYLSDTATIAGNTFSAGTLDIQIDRDPSPAVQTWSNGFTNPYNPFDTVKPGDGGEQIIDIKSAGSIKGGVATIDLNKTSADSDLAGVLNFHVYFDPNNDNVGWVDTGLNGTVDQYTQAYDLGEITSDTGIASVKIVWSVPTTAGNEIQGDSVRINAVFGLNQIANQVN